jgi:CopA family copper-resistance protein
MVTPALGAAASRFDLTIEPHPTSYAGKARVATTVNGTIPGPLLRWREGGEVTIAVTNKLNEPSSIHWHGIRLPAEMDGVPGISFAGIPAGGTFVYRFQVRQNGTYWYHSHSHFQEQTGLFGPLIIEPSGKDPVQYDRDYVIMLSDWTNDEPGSILSNLKMESDYYNYGRRTVGTLAADIRKKGLGATLADRISWNKMNMSPTDLSDVSAAIYTYMINGQPAAANWTALFTANERVRIRFINSSSMTYFDVRIPGVQMTVVQADGNDVEPVVVDEFRIAVAETYDVIVQPLAPIAYTIFAQSADRSGYARATLAPRVGMTAPVPPMDPRPTLTMIDMGMGGMAMEGKSAGAPPVRAGGEPHQNMADMPGMEMSNSDQGMAGMKMGQPALPVSHPIDLKRGPQVDNVAMKPTTRLGTPGAGLDGNGRRVLTYADLRATKPGADPRPPDREIELHLTGNMERYIWGFNGEKFSSAEPLRFKYGERIRITLINDSMMAHPIHLHGLWSELDNGFGAFRPYKHTINVKPGERLSYLVSADVRGGWAYHCHLAFHMETGMFRKVIVA